jgi:hypothetical protein
VTRLGLGLGSSSDRLLFKPGSIRISYRRQSEDDPRKRAGAGDADLRLEIKNPKFNQSFLFPKEKASQRPKTSSSTSHQR